jgi:signal transduction histidine kinase/ActR/RegA family two-component response regulator
MRGLRNVFQPEAWRVALEKYGAATGTTLCVYEAPDVMILGPLHPTALFESAKLGRHDPALFAACVRDCLARSGSPVIVEDQGVAVIGSRLCLGGEVIGAVVAGYGLTMFPEESVMLRFTRRHDLPFTKVWQAIRGQAPITPARLGVYADLLVALTDTLLSENFRTQEYERAAARLAEANQAKDQFLAMLAHELRNPLAPIRIAMQVISISQSVNPEVQKAREVIDRQVGHLTRLLDDLLDVSRITSGKVQLRMESVDLATAVANALEASRDLIQQRGHSLSVSLPENPVPVHVDPLRFEQVITNLVNNAARYTPQNGHISVTARREGASATLRVRDDGIGIPADLLPRVFDLFTQADRSLVRTEGGLGIGLTIVRNLVELHGGTVTGASEGPGRGSEFTVRLPLGGAGEGSAKPSAKKAAAAPRSRVLVVEDNADSREMLRLMLKAEGHEVHVAEDGPHAVELARAVRPDVAAIDIGLPGFDGYEAGRRIRNDLGSAITLIALTGYSRAEDRQHTADAGFDAHLVKPVSPEELRDALAKRHAPAT